jgi:hypothetical protein
MAGEQHGKGMVCVNRPLGRMCRIPGLNRCCFMHSAFRKMSVLVIKSCLFVVLVNPWASVVCSDKAFVEGKNNKSRVSWTCVILRSVSTASQLSLVSRCYFPSLLRTVVRASVIN